MYSNSYANSDDTADVYSNPDSNSNQYSNPDSNPNSDTESSRPATAAAIATKLICAERGAIRKSGTERRRQGRTGA